VYDLPIHLKWLAALQEEMFRQGDQEKALRLTTSPLCDRETMGITQSQVRFVFLPKLKAGMTTSCNDNPPRTMHAGRVLPRCGHAPAGDVHVTLPTGEAAANCRTSHLQHWQMLANQQS
jgi:hypothetical protein